MILAKSKQFGKSILNSVRWLFSDSANVFEAKPFAIGVGALILVLVVNATTAYNSARDVAASSAEITKTVDASSQLESLISSIKDVETAHRGFLISGYAGDFNSAAYNVRTELNSVSETLSKIPGQRQKLPFLTAAIEKHLDRLQHAVSQNPDQALNPKNSLHLMDEGQKTSNAIKGIIQDIKTIQSELRVRQTRKRDENQYRLASTFWLSTALNIGLVLIVAVLVRRIVEGLARERRREQRHALEAITRQQELEIEIAKREEVEAEIQALNSKLEERVVERTRELASAYQEAEAFNYSVAHDLRAPLRAMISASHILIEDFGSELSTGARHELMRQSKAANQLARLIDELLRMSKLARQRLVPTDLDLSSMVNSVAESLKGRDWPKCPEFNVQHDLTATADATQIRFLFECLLENACKFSPKGGTISVGSNEAEEGTVFFVRDQGVGFDPRYLHRIFLPFERLVTEAEFDGTGIGLANAKRIVERHGGKIWAESKLGEGATFYFTLGSVDRYHPLEDDPDPAELAKVGPS
jgi:signal transduction histidine kinase